MEGLHIDSPQERSHVCVKLHVNLCLSAKPLFQCLTASVQNKCYVLSNIIAANNGKQERRILKDHSHIYGQVTDPRVLTLRLYLLDY